MTRTELSAALAVARSDVPLLQRVDISVFDGFGLPGFGPVACTLEALAALIRWQCCQFDGNIDAAALADIAKHGRKRFLVLADVAEPATDDVPTFDVADVVCGRRRAS